MLKYKLVLSPLLPCWRRSVGKLKKLWKWFDDRTGITNAIVPIARHLVPPGSKWNYVFGSATLFAFILQVVTGVALSLMYQPTSETAYQSLQYISNEALLGNILRGIHYFGASAMIILIGLHMIRVYLLAAYKYPREMGWLTGLVLFVLTLAMGFTGQLLRWDSNGIWSAIVAAEQVGRIPFIGTEAARFLLAGETIGGATLSRFFAFHVFLVPALLFGIIGFHIFLVIRNGISEPPKPGRKVDPKTYRSWYHNMLQKEGVPFWPNAAWRDMLFGLVVVTVVILLSVLIGAPKIGAPPDPANIHSNPRPDWYFLWIFALFALMPPSIESYVIAFGPPVAAIILIMLPILFNKGERSPVRRPWSVIIVLFIVTMIATLWNEGIKSPWSPDFEAKPLPAHIVGNIDEIAKQGADLFYKKACLYCHTISGYGGKRGPDLSTVADRLTTDEMKIRIVNGGKYMPPYGPNLSSDELHKIICFLKTRKTEIKQEKSGN